MRWFLKLQHRLPLRNGKKFARTGRIVASEAFPISPRRCLLMGFEYRIRGNPKNRLRVTPHSKRVRLTSPLGNPLFGAIHPFVRTAFPLPLKRRRYNADVRLEPYMPDLLHFAGGKRKGIRDPLTDAWIGNTTRGVPWKRIPHYRRRLPCRRERYVLSNSSALLRVVKSEGFAMFCCDQMENWSEHARYRRPNGLRAFLGRLRQLLVSSRRWPRNSCYIS